MPVIDNGPSNKKLPKIILKHLLLLFIVVSYLVLLYYSGIGCPIRWLTHIPCPTCGTTRSLQALLRLDIVQSWKEYPMLVPLMAAVFLFLHAKTKWLHGKRWISPVIIILAASIFISYLVKICGY